MGIDSVVGVADSAGNVGGVVGKGGKFVGDFFTDVSLYVSNMGFVEWILLAVLGVGGFIVWYLKKKYGLVFRWGPKKRKKSFN